VELNGDPRRSCVNSTSCDMASSCSHPDTKPYKYMQHTLVSGHAGKTSNG
jgi:hypothetical protein